ncbi:alanine racemase [bacterium]|nr:alanine racemase [bacterium]
MDRITIDKQTTQKPSRRAFIKVAGGTLAGITVAGVGIGAFLKPADVGGAYGQYFDKLNHTLKQTGIGRPCIVLDLDRVDHNISRVRQQLQSPIAYRIAAKSLPSEHLIQYVLTNADTNKVMAFHQPYLGILLNQNENIDILLGKPLLIESVRTFFADLNPEERVHASNRIQWLVDCQPRLDNYLKLAQELSLTLNINIEIDVGLRRGGVQSERELGQLLQVIHSNSQNLRFTGFMGYEAHVPYAPPVISSVEGAFAEAMETYSAFYIHGKKEFPSLFEGSLTMNSGGSKTYKMFTGGLHVNDVAAGSCMAKPSTFGILEDHQPALFIAAPVLKKLKGAQLPFLDFASGLIEWWDPNMANSIYLYGGGWAAELVSPSGVRLNGLTADPPNQNLLPNQSLYNGSSKVPLAVGDYVFFHPHQSDSMTQFDEIIVTRGSQIVDLWKPFPKRY